MRTPAAMPAMRPGLSARRSSSAAERPFSSPASRSRALASRICSVDCSSAVAIASSASSLTSEPSVASAREARLAFWQISAIESAVLAMG